MNDYKTIREIADIEEYIGNADVIAFDFETSPTDEYRSDEKAALDAHKSDITGMSISVEKGTGRYIPFRHRVGVNADITTVMEYLRQRLFQHPAPPYILQYTKKYILPGRISSRAGSIFSAN